MKKIIKIILLLVFAITFGISAFQIVKIYKGNQKSNTLNNSLINEAVGFNTKPSTDAENKVSSDIDKIPITVDFDILLSKNKDIIAWVYCPDTPINYPIVKGADNNYYLRRLLDGSWNTAGTIFADYRNSSNFDDFNTIIYGHNMDNGTMFGMIPKYTKQEFYEQHPVWYLLTPNGNFKITLAAGYTTPFNSDLYRVINTKEERDKQVSNAIKNSKFVSDVKVTEEDKLISFSTCSYEYKNARFVLMGVLKEIL